MAQQTSTRKPLPAPRSLRCRAAAWARAHRRGVVSVVAMMFLILFGSLAAAMAIMSRGNIVTAATHQHVMRAMGAAETGLGIAEQRLREAAGRFVVEKGEVDDNFGATLWSGNPASAGYGQVIVAEPASYPAGSIVGAPPVTNISTALVEICMADQNVVGGEIQLTTSRVYSSIVALQPCNDPSRYSNTAFQITWELLPSGTDVRAIVTGYDYGYSPRSEPVTRTLIQDFKIIKRVDAAVLSPSRIMIGKNVNVEGDLAALYDAVNNQYGDPLIIKSDFWGMDDDLDAELTKLFNALASYDIDHDNRLRVGHPVEGPGIPSFNAGYSGAAADVTEDGYVDEFDVFIMHYDANRDGRVALSAAVAAGTPGEGLTPEFVDSNGRPIDDDLALLIDSVRPDRNRNGIWSFTDNDGDNRFTPGIDELHDIEPVNPASLPAHLQSYVFYVSGEPYVYSDQLLGYRDGVIDRRDRFSKVTGRLVFRVTQSQWAAAQGNYRDRLRGPIRAERNQAPVYFGATESQLPDLTSASFTNSQTALRAQANGAAFLDQVAANLGVPVGQLAVWDPATMNPPGANAPKYRPVFPDVAPKDGLPDNWNTAYFEKSPFNSPTYFDWYYRPVYENMIFRNVQIPIGNNGLYKNCTFIGVTWVRTTVANTHPNWTIYGKMVMHPTFGKPWPSPERKEYEGTSPPPMIPVSDYPILIAEQPLDKADIPEDEINTTIGYWSLPEPLWVDGRRLIDTKVLSNNIRFHDCIFVGGIVSDTPQEYTNTRNKMEFTGATRFVPKHPQYPEDPNFNPSAAAAVEIAKSTMMLPNYSIDIGSFNSPPEQDVRLRGAIVAGVLDVRGNAMIDGSLLLTFKPVLGQVPLVQNGQPIGNPAMFNATIGYFGVEDGDDESLDPESLPIVTIDGEPKRLVGWDIDDDGLPDLGPTATPPAGAVPIPFYGYGRVHLRFDPNLAMPDGIMLPLQVEADRGTYREAKQ